MFANIKDTIIKGNKFFGISIYMHNAENWDLWVCELHKKRNKIEIVATHYCASLQDIFGYISKGSICSISLMGNGVIHKKMEREENKTDLQHILTNAIEEDFYSQSDLIQNNLFYFSAIRKETIQNLISILQEQSIFIANIFLGCFTINDIASLLEPNNLLIPNTKVSLENGVIQGLQFSENTKSERYSISGQVVDSEYVLPFSLGIHYFINQLGNVENETIKNIALEYKYKNILKACFYSCLATVLLSLILNFLVFSEYRKSYSKKQILVEKQKSILDKIKSLEVEFNNKKKFLIDNKLENNLRLSYYADRLASILPKDLKLSMLNLNPLYKKIKVKRKVELMYNTISIEGTTNNSNSFNKYINRLNKEKWVKEIAKEEYFKTYSDLPAVFKIKIIVE